MASFSMGTAAGTDIPIEHLDYDYIGKCSNVREVEKMLKALRSEGQFPGLIRFTEERLLKLNPKSKLLIKDQKVRSTKDLPQEQFKELVSDLENWTEKVKSEETTGGDDDSLPPVRRGGVVSGKPAEPAPRRNNPERIKSHDYQAWDKYDTDKEVKKVDMSADAKPPERATKISPTLSDKEARLPAAEKERLATKEKGKGNEAFHAGDYQEAVAYYTRSVKLHQSPAAYNNRAIAFIKLERFSDALQDCSEVLQVEPENIKALLRQATAHTGLKEHRKAAEDLEQVLRIEPNNKKAQEQLNQLRKDFPEEGRQKGKKGRRIQIAEVEDSRGDEATVGSESVAKGCRSNEAAATTESAAVTMATGAEGSKGTPQDESTSIPDTRTKSQPQATSTLDHMTNPSPPPVDTTRPQASTPHKDAPPPPLVQRDPPPPFPLRVQSLKDEGNVLFRSGQYGDAVKKYSEAIRLLEGAGKEHEPNVATLLNNQAACHLKIGDCRRCIEDCTLSIALTPLNVKALMRRGAAYEALEKYKLAYNDFHLALRIDNTIPSAYTACSRITLLLRELEGNNWRNKLPPHAEAERILATLSELRTPLLTPTGASSHEVEETSTTESDQQEKVHPAVQTPLTSPGSHEDEGTSTTESDEREKVHPAVQTPPTSPGSHEDEGTSTRESDQQEKIHPQTPPTSASSHKGKETSTTESDQQEKVHPAVQTPPTSAGSHEDEGTSTTESDEGEKVHPAVQTPPTSAGSHEDEGTSTTESDEREKVHPAVQTPPTSPGSHEDEGTSTRESDEREKVHPARPSKAAVSEPQMAPSKPVLPEERFTRLKDKGNEHVKKGEFGQALKCYSLCIQTCPEKAVAYTNRALCNLKLNKPRNAEDDCTKALRFEPNNVKALYRRGQARKALKRYSEAAKDLKTLLDIDPKNSAAKKELAAVKDLWGKELREIQSKQQDAPRSGQRGQRPGVKSPSGSGKRSPGGQRGNGKRQQSGSRKSTFDNLHGSQNDPGKKSAVETLLGGRASDASAKTNPPAEDASDGFLTPRRTTYYKETASQEGRSDQSSVKRKRIVIEERESSSSSSSEEEGDSFPPAVEKMAAEFEGGFPPAVEKMAAEFEGGFPPAVEKMAAEFEGGFPPAVEKMAAEFEGGFPPAVEKMAAEFEGGFPSAVEKMAAEFEGVGRPQEPVQQIGDEREREREKLPSGYEFIQKWNAIPRTAKSIEYAKLLELIPPTTLPEVITNKLDGIMLTNIIRAIDKQFIPKGKYQLSVDILENLTKVPRFGMIAMFLNPKEKQDLASVFSILSTQEAVEIPPTTLGHLRDTFRVDA